MHSLSKRRAFLGLDRAFLAACIFISGSVASVTPARAQSVDTITNLAQLTQSFSLGNQRVADLELDATVFACDTNTGALILEDSSGAALLEVDGLKDDLKAGDVIHIEAKPGIFSL